MMIVPFRRECVALYSTSFLCSRKKTLQSRCDIIPVGNCRCRCRLTHSLIHTLSLFLSFACSLALFSSPGKITLSIQIQWLVLHTDFRFLQPIYREQTILSKASKITITFKNELDRKSKSSQVSALVISSYYISRVHMARQPMGTLVKPGLTFGWVVK